MINAERIDAFLSGHNELKYVVVIECNNYSNIAELIIHNPETNEKTIQNVKFTPFIYLKDFKKCGLTLYENNSVLRDAALKKFGIKIKILTTKDDQGDIERLNLGYKYLVTAENGTYNKLMTFFKDGGIDFRSIKQIYNDRLDKYTIIEEEFDEANNKIEQVQKKILAEEFKFKKYDDKDDSEVRASILAVLNEGKTKGKTTERAFLKKKALIQEKIATLQNDLWEKKEDLKPLEEEKNNRYEVFSEIRDKKECAFELPVVEQFMISTGIRLFKGYENYNDLEKFYFDIETTGLHPGDSRIFLIGCKTNKGFRHILGVKDEDDDESERNMIRNFFYLYSQKIKPAIMAGFNSENFDWNFILRRAEILGIIPPKDPLKNYNQDFTFQTTFSDERKKEDNNLFTKNIQERRSTLKLGNEKEYYEQKIIYGINNIDIWHSVRRAKAINSDIKETNLKYIAKFAKVAKPDRTYIPHDKIYKYWFENKKFIINRINSEYYVVPDEFQDTPDDYLTTYNTENKLEFELTTGKELVTNYLQDDLDETEGVDNTYNEQSFMLAKYIPSSFSRIATAGGASVWNLIMTTWSYENNLAIPCSVKKRSFVGGLSRTFRLGRSKNILKADFAGLYPSIQLAHDVFPRHDIQGALKGLLHYFRDTRNKFKALAQTETDEKLQMFYNSKQLPIKILNNSMFGAFGSEYFNWSDYDKAEEITCRGRLYLRNMVSYFMTKGFQPVILDTDGVSLSVPDSYALKFIFVVKENKVKIEQKEFTSYEDGKAALALYMTEHPNNWKQKKGDVFVANDIELKLFLDESELEILFEELNKKVFKEDIIVINDNIMKVDNDGRWEACITVGRKNYANLEFNGKVKLVGNSIKSSALSDYIEEFLNKGLKMLLKGQGKEFIEYYFSYVADIVNKEIPLKKMATKKKIKQLPQEYYNRGNNKNGRKKNIQVHMELIILNNMSVNLGESVYYINNGLKKNDKDSGINKVTNEFNAYIIDSQELEKNPDKKGDYNVPKYLEAFNERIEPLLICFNENIVENLLISKPEDKTVFNEEDYELQSWVYDDFPYEKERLDPISELFTMDDREVDFWNKVLMNPYDIFKDFVVNDGKKINIEYIKKYREYYTKVKEKGLTLRTKIDDMQNEEVIILDDNGQLSLHWQKDGVLEFVKNI